MKPVRKTSDAAPVSVGVSLSSLSLPKGSSQSLREEAYEQIKHKIITCVFKPGEYLNEAWVSEVIGIGRTPVRQAVDRLAQDGLLEVIPRKGVVVKPLGLDEIVQIIEARRINEAFCMRLAAQRATEDDLSAIEDIMLRAAKAKADQNTEQMMLLDREFHIALTRAAHNPVLAGMLQNLHERSLRFWFISLGAADRHHEVQNEHEAIYKALKKRDADKAEAVMIDHIDSFHRTITGSLEQIGKRP